MPDGLDSNRLWKKMAASAAAPAMWWFPRNPGADWKKYEELLPHFLETKALAFSSDYTAVEAINFFTDKGIRIPDQIFHTGFDDNFYAQIVRPKLTTIHQDIHQKAVLALRKLLLMAEGKEPAEKM